MNPVLFVNLEGPLLDVAPRYAAVHRDLMRAAGKRGLSADRYWERKRACVSELDILSELEADAYAAEYLRLQAESLEMSAYLALDRPWPWTHDVLTRLAARYPLVLIALRSKRPLLLEQLDRLEMVAFFREILSEPECQDAVAQKARMIRCFLAESKLDAHGWLIGDTETDISAAQETGLYSAGVLSGMRNNELLAPAEPDAIVHDIREVPTLLLRHLVADGVAEFE